MNMTPLWVLIAGIIFMKSVWIFDEIRLFKNRVNFTMIKTNFIETGILVLQVLQSLYFPLPVTPYDRAILYIGIIMYATGMIFAFLGKFGLDRVWGIPGEHKSRQQHTLVTDGIYTYSRNPIYVGIFLIFTGFSIAIKSWLVILRLPLFIYLYRSAVKEEKLLEKKFGKKYSDYKARTPRFLLGF
jgi:protein-S-isoprenylcysteine O-methyltransferase Ste14